MNKELAVTLKFSGLKGTGKTVLSDYLYKHFQKLGIKVERSDNERYDDVDTLYVNVSLDTVMDLRKAI